MGQAARDMGEIVFGCAEERAADSDQSDRLQDEVQEVHEDTFLVRP